MTFSAHVNFFLRLHFVRQHIFCYFKFSHPPVVQYSHFRHSFQQPSNWTGGHCICYTIAPSCPFNSPLTIDFGSFWRHLKMDQIWTWCYSIVSRASRNTKHWDLRSDLHSFSWILPIFININPFASIHFAQLPKRQEKCFAVCPIRPDKSERQDIQAFGENCPDNAWFFVILPGFCDLVHIYRVIGLFAKRKNNERTLITKRRQTHKNSSFMRIFVKNRPDFDSGHFPATPHFSGHFLCSFSCSPKIGWFS